MYEKALQLISEATKIVVVQGENPDGDSLGSSLALEELLSQQGKTVTMYCATDIPKYMRYTKGWDRVESVFPTDADLAIIVDTSSDILISKALETPGVRAFFESHPVLVIDHHTTPSTLSFDHTSLIVDAVATGEALYGLAEAAEWSVSAQAAEDMLIAIMSDSLGLTTQNVTPNSFFVASKLVECGASPAEIENRRREFMKKSPEILAYKGELISRIEYFLEGKLALIHIPWDEIKQYSDQYNPSVLVLDEMRLVEGVEIGVAVKTYPDGKLTGKIRSNIPIAEEVAGYFGGGGHQYAAGFRVYESYDTIIKELLTAVDQAIKAHGHDTPAS